MESAIDISELFPLSQSSQVKVEDAEVESNTTTIETIESLLQLYKKENKIDYDSITSEDCCKLLTNYSPLHWLDQIKVKLLHQEMKVFLYPHIRDSFGYKFTKKNHQATKGKITVYYYCEAYKDCPVGIKLCFSDDCKSFQKVT